MPTPIDQLRVEDFSLPDGQLLSLQRDDVAISCSVDSVRRLPAHHLRTHPPFAVTLRGPQTPSLPQGMASLRHPTRGLLELFIVPIGPCDGGLGYELTFN